MKSISMVSGIACAAVIFAGLLALAKDQGEIVMAPSRPADLPAFEKKVQEVYERVAPSTVTLFGPQMQYKGSGVIIDPKGLVLTHGHHDLEPGTPMTVAIGGKRKVAAKLLGVHHYYDQSLIQLDDKGPWPAVPLGNPKELQPGEACIMLGFPKIYYQDGRPPLVRLGRVLGFVGPQIISSCRLEGGDSGGPLFNMKGELLGTNCTSAIKGEHGAGHPSVECFLQIRERLLAGELIKKQALEGAFEDPSALAELASVTHRSVVQVLLDGKPVGLGLIIDADGWIVTKASAITLDQVVCQLADGRRLEASVAGRIRAHDLGLLKVKADELVAASWAEAGAAKPGQILASVGIEPRPLAIGVVCSPLIDVPRERGQLTINLAPADAGVAGLRITEVWKGRDAVARVVRVGDVVTHINGVATPDVETFVRVREKQLDDPATVVGDTIPLTILRDGKVMKVEVPIESESFQQMDEFRGRRTGFPAVFTHDGTVPRKQLGGPVVDAQGKVIGVNIATIWGAFTYAIPAEVVRKAVAEAKNKAAVP
ncbi:MAG TPA: trypsin-like peptidase domain-containing protein [Tepidisphaeraceae bacterium]|jgi:serine protease Do|nr:trypsin-like peptidase domain-containing protein [Tepidisphaeraceae bacterium]